MDSRFEASVLERLKLGEKEIILVGTAHVSAESVEEVRKTIEREKPDIVGVELDEQRLRQLQMGDAWKELNVFHIMQSGQAYLFLLNLLLASMQRQIGEKFGVKPGGEMLAAIHAAAEQQLPIAMLDRPINISFKRAIAHTSLVEKIKLLGSVALSVFSEPQELTKEKIEELKKEDVLNKVLQELGQKAPGVKKALVDERDEFIALRISKAPGKKIVAVVGAGHVQGLKLHLQRLGRGERIDEKKLLEIPKPNKTLKYIGYAIPVLFATFLLWAFYARGWEQSLNVFATWFLITGTASAIGALLARAHPFSIITAFVAAPFTTLHPALASGWFAGLVEAKMVEPKVKDFEGLSRLQNYEDFQKNRVTHLLLVAAFTNIGSMVGVVIALPYLTKLLF